MRYLLPLFLIVFAAFTTNAQTLNGRVVGKDTLSPVPYAHIVNLRTQLGVACNEQGYFQIAALPGDSLYISALGYKQKRILCDEAMFGIGYVTFRMESYTYSLDEVVIDGHMSWDEFRDAFVGLRLPDEDVIYIKGLHYPKMPLTPNKPNPVFSPISFMYSKFSRKERMKVHAQRMIQPMQQGLNNWQRYNPTVVKSIVPIEDEELEAFMAFCNLNASFIASASDYDLLVAIKTCYNEWEGD